MKPQNPFEEFWKVLENEGFSLQNSGIITPDLPSVLATCGKNLIPSSRVLFIKKFINNEFLFFTNKKSRKGREISENPKVSLCFFFQKSCNQIRICGEAFEAEHEIAEKYFETRSNLSKIGAVLSLQSAILSNYDDFVNQVHNFKGEVKCPKTWVCYKIIPNEFEFWEKRDFRLHWRILYEKKSTEWIQNNLYP